MYQTAMYQTAPVSAGPHNETAPDPGRWAALAVVIAAQFVYVVDAFIVNVGIPSIRADLSTTVAEIQGVIVVYQIAFATLVIAGGRVGDIFGSKRVLLIGLAAFTLASMWCGLARSGTELVLARAAQGAAAALMVPQVLATILTLFKGAERGRAFGIFGATLGLGGAIGFALGGFLIAINLLGLGWRAVFFVNLPIGALLILAAMRLIPSTIQRRDVHLDLASTAILFVALLCILGPLLLGPDLHWPQWLWPTLAFGVVLLTALRPIASRIERRSGLPLVPTSVMRDRDFALGALAVVAFLFGNISFYLVTTLYLQQGLAATALQSGLAIVPLGLAFAIASRWAAPRAQRLGERAILQGLAVQMVGLACAGIAVASVELMTWDLLAVILILFGVGQGMVFAPLYGLVLSRIPPAHAGSGAGIVNTLQQIGNAGGVAVIGALFLTVQTAQSTAAAYLAALTALVVALAVTAGLVAALANKSARDRSSVC